MKALKTLALLALLALTSITAQAEVTYTNNLDDEFENYKVVGVRISEEDNKYTYLEMSNRSLDSNAPYKHLFIINPKNNRTIGNCYAYDYSCTLMVKFDDLPAKGYKFKADVSNFAYTLQGTEDVNEFMNKIAKHKKMQIKINSQVLKYDISQVKNLDKIKFK